MRPLFDAPPLIHAFDVTVDLAPIMEMGAGRAGKRRIIPIIGGTVTGERVTGRVLDLGADWQTIWADGTAELDTRYAIETDDGAVIEVINYGRRFGPPEVMARVAAGEDVDPSEYYMRTHCRLESGDPRYAWINAPLFLSTGGRRASSVVISFYHIG